MRRKILSIFHLLLKWAEKGRGAGIEHFTVAIMTGLLTFLNINTLQITFGFRPFFLYEYDWIYFTVYLALVLLFFKLFLPKKYLLSLEFSERELKFAKMALLIYFIVSIAALSIIPILNHPFLQSLRYSLNSNSLFSS
jgi:hypothetical protein